MPEEEAVGFSEEGAERIIDAVRTVERSPGQSPRGRQYGGRRERGPADAILLEDIEHGDQQVKAVLLEPLDEGEEAQFISLRGAVEGGESHPDSVFKLRAPDSDSASSDASLASAEIRPDATAAEVQSALSSIFTEDEVKVSEVPRSAELERFGEVEFDPVGRWWLKFAPDFIENNGETYTRFGKTLTRAPAVTATENNLRISSSTSYSNFVLVQRTRWVPTDRIVDVSLEVPVHSLTTAGNSGNLVAGTQVGLRWIPKLGYTIALAESFFLRLFIL